MIALQTKKFFTSSLVGHVIILLVLVLGFDFSTPLPVLENTNKQDIISAVVLGDSPSSKVLPTRIESTPLPPKPRPVEVKPRPKPQIISKPAVVKPAPVKAVSVKKDAIALKAKPKKPHEKTADAKELLEKMQHELLTKQLLADIQQQKEKQKKLKQQAEVDAKFQKTLREQAEKSLRQQLLNEDIKLQASESRQAQGEIDKYKALILQQISEQWIVPTQSNKKLYSELVIRLAPGGKVLDVQIAKSSGDPALDSSARAAVLKASPLPVPPDARAFEPFRHFVLKVKPENILANNA